MKKKNNHACVGGKTCGKEMKQPREETGGIDVEKIRDKEQELLELQWAFNTLLTDRLSRIEEKIDTLLGK